MFVYDCWYNVGGIVWNILRLGIRNINRLVYKMLMKMNRVGNIKFKFRGFFYL